MIRAMAALALGTALLLSAPAQAATVVNVNAITNASLDGTNAVAFSLAAGTYKVTFVTDAYTAFTRFSSIAGCDGTGAKCTTGYENSARIVLGGSTILFGDGNASGGIGPIGGGGYYDSAANAFAKSGKYSLNVTVLAPTTGSAYIYDDILGDNSGGVSLSFSAVPEPMTWALMILGFGAAGFAMRSFARRSERKFNAKIKAITEGVDA